MRAKTKERTHDADSTLGMKIRVLRGMKKVSSEALSLRIGVTYEQMQQYEMGRASMPFAKVAETASALGVSIVDLIPEQYRHIGDTFEDLAAPADLSNRILSNMVETIGLMSEKEQLALWLMLPQVREKDRE
jgi:transcriptional regulator with XRE-family HTH domain